MSLGSKEQLMEQLRIQNRMTPLIGANILVSGSTTGTVTDFDGKFHT